MNKKQQMIDAIRGADIKPIPEAFLTPEGMVGEGLEYARAMLVGTDPEASLSPTWNLVSNRGQVTMLMTPFSGGMDKDAVAMLIRELINEAGIVRYSFTCEAWVAIGQPGEKWDGRAPSERDDRIEVVMITAADREQTVFHTYEIKRGDNGEILDLVQRGDMNPAGTQSSGRFSNMFDEEVQLDH